MQIACQIGGKGNRETPGLTNRITCCLHLAVPIRGMMTGEDHIQDATSALSTQMNSESHWSGGEAAQIWRVHIFPKIVRKTAFYCEAWTIKTQNLVISVIKLIIFYVAFMRIVTQLIQFSNLLFPLLPCHIWQTTNLWGSIIMSWMAWNAALHCLSGIFLNNTLFWLWLWCQESRIKMNIWFLWASSIQSSLHAVWRPDLIHFSHLKFCVPSAVSNLRGANCQTVIIPSRSLGVLNLE